MAVSIAALAIGAGIAIYGAVKKSQDAKKAANNVRPTYDIPQSEFDSQRLVESQANQGMSAGAKQAYQNEADQGLAATNNAILMGGGDANSIGNSYNSYQKGINNLAVYDDQARMAHLNNLNNSYLRMSANEDKKWQINQYGKWADTAQALAAQQAGDVQTMNSGIGIAGQGIGGLAKGIGNSSSTPSMNMRDTSGDVQESALPMSGAKYMPTTQPSQQQMQPADNPFMNGWGWHSSQQQ